jgi:hypothetical protein
MKTYPLSGLGVREYVGDMCDSCSCSSGLESDGVESGTVNNIPGMLIPRVCWESEGDVVDYESAKRKSENNLRYFEASDWLTKELSLVTARHQ